MAIETLTGSQLIESIRTRIEPIAQDYLDRLAHQPYGQYKAIGLEQAIKDGSEIGIINQLPARTFGDKLWKHSVMDAFAAKGHDVLDEDTRDYDSRECNTFHEYKAARVTSVAGTHRVIASNPTRKENVKVDLFVADGDTLEECGFYLLGKATLDRFARPWRHGVGWSLNVTTEALRDMEGLGQYRMTADEYILARTRRCRCA